MFIRKPTALLSTLNTIHILPNSLSASSTSSKPSTRASQTEQRRHATIASHSASDSDCHHAEPKHEWPKPLRGQATPTPYQIFALKQNGVYSKAQFYHLVKIYHPDKNGSGSGSSTLPHSIKAERYRLVVAAHTILSDPVRRSAYDRFGAGWNGRAEVNKDGSPGTQKSQYNQTGPFTHSWHDNSDPIWQNATWEDWERFYARRAGSTEFTSAKYRAPVYMKNTYFLALIIACIMVGGSWNVNRAQEAGVSFIEQRDAAHDRAAKELRKVRQQREGMMGREERIQWFIRQREATLGLAGSDPHTMRQEQADRLLPHRDVCRSEDISESPT